MSQPEKSRITVEIHKRPYTIVGHESPQHVRMVASLVDQKMQEIHEMNKSLDTTRLAVLTAVNTMNDYLKLRDSYTELLGTIKQKKDQDNHD